MVCESCKAHTAASPIGMEEAPAGDAPAQVTPEAFAELSARVSALEDAMMGSEMAQLASLDVAIPATV